MNSDSQPLANAQVTLYGKTSTANSNGCFKTQLADALPFTFVVAAVGYKPIETKASTGFYRVEAKLASAQSPANSQVEWVPITETEYRSAKPCE